MYVPGTCIIKGMMAVFAWGIAFWRGQSSGYTRTFSALLAEIWMVLGYLMYEGVILGYGLAAVGSILGNTVQGFTSLVLSVSLYRMLKLTGITHYME